MDEIRSDKRINLIKILFGAVMICLCMAQMFGICGFSLFPDEFGYWSVAASLTGRDWSGILSLGSYYSFGYGLLLTPIFMLAGDSIAAYRIAVLVNLIMQVGGFLLLCDIAEDLAADIDREKRVILCGIVSLYPSLVIYTQTTMAEGLIFFLFIVSIRCMTRYIRDLGAKNAVLLALIYALLYSVHLRTAGLAAAGMIVMVIYVWRQKKEDTHRRYGIIIFFVLSAVLFVLLHFIKGMQQGYLYRNVADTVLSVNDYTGQLDKLTELLTFRGLLRFIMSLPGKLMYIGCAGFGITYIGIAKLKSAAVSASKDGPEDEMAGRGICMYIALSVIFTLIITNIYLIGSADVSSDRLDLFINGRYLDFLIPVMMFTGLAELIRSERYVRMVIAADAVMIVMAAACSLIISVNETAMNDPHDMLMIGVSSLIPSGTVDNRFYPFVAALISIVVSWAVVLTVWVSRKHMTGYIYILPVVINIVLSLIACDRMVRPAQSYIYGDIQLADHIAQTDEGAQRRIVDLYESGNAYADNIQFRLRDRKMYAVSIDDGVLDKSLLNADDMVLTDIESGLKEELDSMYKHRTELGHFALYYN